MPAAARHNGKSFMARRVLIKMIQSRQPPYNDGALGQTISDLTALTKYGFYVRAVCATDDRGDLAGPKQFSTPATNNNLCGAIMLEVGKSCTGASYSNVGATLENGEIVGSCFSNPDTSKKTVWFKFVAPKRGEVTLTTDLPDTSLDTQVVVYEAPTACTDLSTLGREIGCNDDVGLANKQYNASSSTLSLSDLTSGSTCYVQVGAFNNSEGEFCLQIEAELGLETNDLDDFTYYPNPVSDRLTLKAGSPVGQVIVYDLLGHEVISRTPEENEAQLNTSNWKSGIYLMKIFINGKTQIFKIVKK